MGAKPGGEQIAMQAIEQWAQQPDVAERLQQDEAFAGRVQKYVELMMRPPLGLEADRASVWPSGLPVV